MTLKAGTAVNLGGNITTIDVADNNVDITGPVVLTADTTINTSANAGTIDFSSTINNDGLGTAFDLTLNSDGGAITVDSTIGNLVAVKGIDINASGGAGDITLNGIGNGTTTAGNAGQVDIGNAATDQLKLAGTFFTNGQTTYKASGTANGGDENIEITGTTTFKTSDDALIFSTAAIDIANTANLTIDTGAGSITLT